MFDPEHEAVLKKSYFMASAAACALLGSVFIFEFIAHVAGPKVEIMPEGHENFRRLMYGLALLSLAVSPLVSKLVLVFLVNKKKIARAELTLKDMASLTARRMTAMLIGMSFCEATALYGFVLFFTTGNRTDFLTLAFIGIAGIALQYPRFEHWRSWIESNIEPW